MQRRQHGMRVGFRNTQERAGGAFGAAVALFPVLEGAGADADKRGELNLPFSPFIARPFRLSTFPTTRYHMKPYHTRLTILALTALAGFAAHAAGLETTQPVAAKTNGEKWWNGNCERILTDIMKMEG